jgi:DNA-binding NarL/FixJ family response regulator
MLCRNGLLDMERHILIADDHALVRGGIVTALQRLYPDARIYEACSAEEALQCASQLPMELDLALVDLFMPDMDGFEFLRQLCDEHPALPVAVLSASDDEEHVRKALAIGASGFISKAVPEHEFANALNIVCAGGTYPPVGQRRPSAPGQRGKPAGNSADNTAPGELTSRQREILNLLGQGKSNKQIARELDLSENTVKVHVSAILRALRLENRTQAGLLAGKLAAHT